jgi:hypothetical protein
MYDTMRSVIAHEHAADLERVADLYREAERGSETSDGLATKSAARVEVRVATAEDGDAVAWLAAMDDARELNGPVLLAVLDGHAVAALSVEDARVVANPFVACADAVAMLRLRAEQLTARPRRGWQRRWRRLRLTSLGAHRGAS